MLFQHLLPMEIITTIRHLALLYWKFLCGFLFLFVYIQIKGSLKLREGPHAWSHVSDAKL